MMAPSGSSPARARPMASGVKAAPAGRLGCETCCERAEPGGRMAATSHSSASAPSASVPSASTMPARGRATWAPDAPAPGIRKTKPGAGLDQNRCFDRPVRPRHFGKMGRRNAENLPPPRANLSSGWQTPRWLRRLISAHSNPSQERAAAEQQSGRPPTSHITAMSRDRGGPPSPGRLEAAHRPPVAASPRKVGRHDGVATCPPCAALDGGSSFLCPYPRRPHGSNVAEPGAKPQCRANGASW
jgi:hypothetical protein